LQKLQLESNKQIFIILSIIIVSSIFLKLYTIDFSLHEIQDTWVYVLRGIAHSAGDYAESPIKPSGYPLFLSLFFNFLDSENFIDYLNVTRVLAIVISSISIIPLYFLGNHFFDRKFSLLLPLFFAFQPQLNFNAGQGLSEPYFLLILIFSLYFILNKNSNFSPYVSFILVGLLFWVRFTGILFIFPFIITHFLIYRDVKKLFLCCLVFLLVISPILVLRDDQYGSPLYFSGVSDERDYEYLPEGFRIDYFKTSFSHLFVALTTMSLPYLLILAPLGIILIKKIPYNRKNFYYNLIFIIFTLFPIIIQYHEGTSARPLYHLYPFFMIFAIVPIKIIYENKINFLQYLRNKNLLILLVLLIITSSGLVTLGIDDYGYGKRDKIEINEIHDYVNYLFTLNGDIFWSKGVSISWISVTMIDESNGGFRDYKLDPEIGMKVYLPESLENIYPINLNIHYRTNAKSIDDFFIYLEKSNINYLSIGEKNELQYLDKIYENEQNFPSLKKIFDSKRDGFEKFNVKLFEIDHDIIQKIYIETGS